MRHSIAIFAAALTAVALSAGSGNPTSTSEIANTAQPATFDMILPKPVSVVPGNGWIDFAECRVQADGVDAAVREAAQKFASDLKQASGTTASGTWAEAGLAARVKTAVTSVGRKVAKLTLKQVAGLHTEGYRLTIEPAGVTIEAGDRNGFLYALQTLRQLLPESIYAPAAGTAQPVSWTLPCGRIEDYPFFSYRGAHLDIARHFFGVDEVKKYLDAMALCKMNRFHWHLTDDQGWRIQIDKYPQLTAVGGWRKGTQIGFDRTSCDGVRYGGYYTKDQIREVVRYAEKLGIEVIPEIDLPGHMLAALSIFPELGCTGGPYEMWTRWGISDQVLCAGNEKIYEFLQDVLWEVADLFPCEMFHIGGDECPKTAWKACPKCQAKIAELGFTDSEDASKEEHLQNYVMGRIQQILAVKGKKVIGWDEILKGTPAPGTTIMHWRGGHDCTEAARRGYDVILVPSNVLYIDHCQVMDYKNAPPSISRDRVNRFVTFSRCYAFEPFKGLDEQQRKHVLGVQCNLWTEYIATPEHLEYMAMPRMFAAAELQWVSPEAPKDLERVVTAVKQHEFKVLDAMGFVYCHDID